MQISTSIDPVFVFGSNLAGRHGKGVQVIRAYVGGFLNYARQRPNISFELTPIGCGLAGYRPEQIAPMFSDAPPNVILPEAFQAVLAAGPPES